MSFNTIVIGDTTFNSIGEGRYLKDSVTFGNPRDYFVVSGGSYNARSGLTTASVTRHLEKDIVSAAAGSGGSELRKCTIQCILQVPHGFSTAEVDSLLQQTSTWVTGPILERLLQGET